ncbi:DUF5753 domain-containing protein [Solwaraspora sp. WMMB335]|uniref:DUF5753 domain-containing protein n=1 Tax=Solwaraspora sp. WMMB335 TaxID=3404118 RepID=UPI003B94F080
MDKAFDTALAEFYREFVVGEQVPVWLHPFVVPGLLQTEVYAREVLAVFEDDPGADLNGLVAARIARQSILSRKSPCRLVAVVDEMVFHREVGSRAVMREQIGALTAAAERPSVQIHVIPLGTGLYPGLHGGLVLATVDGRTVGFLDGYLRGRIVEAPDDTARLEDAWELTRDTACRTGRAWS